MRTFLFLLFIASFFLTCCNNPVGNDMPKVHSNGIMYFVDTNTGLCYAKVESQTEGAYEVTSITCVPCDSLKRIGLIK